MTESSESRPLTMTLFVTTTAVLAGTVAYYFVFKRKQRQPHVLHICTKCSLNNRPEFKNETNGTLASGISAQPSFTVGEQLQSAIWQALNERNKEWKLLSAWEMLFEHIPSKNLLRLNPVQCMSGCQRACTVALAHPFKHSYHFADLNLNQKENKRDVDELLTFVAEYVSAEGQFKSKAGDRPASLGKAHTLSRLPPQQCETACGEKCTKAKSKNKEN